VLFADDRCANLFEALVGTLRAAKKRKVLPPLVPCLVVHATLSGAQPSTRSAGPNLALVFAFNSPQS
jgi:hypothetical protein